MGYSSDLGTLEFELGVKTLERWLLKPEKTMSIAIAIPRERAQDERRVALSPAGVQILTEQGIRVVVESKAGIFCNFHDHDYAEAGALIASSPDATPDIHDDAHARLGLLFTDRPHDLILDNSLHIGIDSQFNIVTRDRWRLIDVRRRIEFTGCRAVKNT
ncbi:MAG TPA: hypothetical protein ENL01_04205, partial [Chlorobaculum parvum]|nr:hypothetical protein [Chlorobaculum parvum]